jgi:hypothetical protein
MYVITIVQISNHNNSNIVNGHIVHFLVSTQQVTVLIIKLQIYHKINVIINVVIQIRHILLLIHLINVINLIL